MALIRLTIDEPAEEFTELILAVPIDTPDQRVRDIDVSGFDASHARASNSLQPVLKLTRRAGEPGEVAIRIEEQGDSFPAWIFTSTGARHETPAPDLVDLVAEVAPSALPEAVRVERIIRHIESRFTYGVREIGLGDDQEAMPALSCGLHAGTCVDTHSYGVAAFRAAGILAAYISGLFFAEGTDVSAPGHCWMALDVADAPRQWDVSHFLKYQLGPVTAAKNPKPGFRYAMAVGRDTVVGGSDGPVTFTRLCGFNVVSGPQRGRKLQTRAVVSERT